MKPFIINVIVRYGFKKTKSITIHNIISKIQGINAIGNKDDIEIQIDENFYKENNIEIHKKIKAMQLIFEIKFISKSLPKEIYEFNHELINKVKNNTKEIFEKNKSEDISNETSYRRKIKKKIIENKN